MFKCNSLYKQWINLSWQLAFMWLNDNYCNGLLPFPSLAQVLHIVQAFSPFFLVLIRKESCTSAKHLRNQRDFHLSEQNAHIPANHRLCNSKSQLLSHTFTVPGVLTLQEGMLGNARAVLTPYFGSEKWFIVADETAGGYEATLTFSLWRDATLKFFFFWLVTGEDNRQSTRAASKWPLNTCDDVQNHWKPLKIPRTPF